MHTYSYNTPLSGMPAGPTLSGPFRSPRQMLAEQEYDGHKSVHDGDVASGLGLKDAPIEGPTHFTQFVPLLVKIWGNKWYEQGCFSAHFKNMVVEGEQVKAHVTLPSPDATSTLCWAEKADGTLVLEASASIGSDGETLLEKRLARLRPIKRLVILEDLKVGMTGQAEERVSMAPNQHLGSLYPFSLNQKLDRMTENSPFYSDAAQSPWGKAIIPLEMVSVLAFYTSAQAQWPIWKSAIGIFADLEIRMINGPLFIGQEYLIRREIIALSESRRTEGFWTRSRIFDSSGKEQVAEVLLHQAFFKASVSG